MAKKDELEFEGGIENAPKPNNSEKLKALQAAMDKIEKSFGKGSIMKMGDDHVQEVEVIPTGSIALNAALGVGGYPKGREFLLPITFASMLSLLLNAELDTVNLMSILFKFYFVFCFTLI